MSARLALAALLAGCVTPVTEVMVVIGGDITPTADVDAVRVTVARQGRGEAASHDVVYDLRSGRFPFPGTLGVVVDDPDDRAPLVVTVTASRQGRARLTAQSSGTPLPRAVARLDVTLARRCLDATAPCPAGTTCGLTGCVPVSRDPLGPWTAP